MSGEPGESLSYVSLPVETPARPRRWAISEIVAWCVILLASTAAVYFSARMKQDPRDAHAAEEMQLLTMSRYVVGVHAIYAQAGSAAAATGPDTAPAVSRETIELLKQVDSAAKTPGAELRAAIVHGELENKAAAVDRLAALAVNHPELSEDITLLQQVYAGDPPPGETVDALRQRLGWFADLAAGTGRGNGEPHRTALSAAYRTVVSLFGAIIGGLGAMASGLVVMILLLSRFRSGKMRRTFEAAQAGDVPGVRPAADRRAYIMGFALYMAGMMSFGVILRTVLHVPAPFSFASLPLAFLAGAAWPLFRRQTWAQFRATVGLYTPAGFIKECLFGWLGYLAGLPILGVGFLLVIFLTRVSGANPSHPITEELKAGPWALALAFILASVWAPITEELMFRGMFFAHLRQRFGWWISAPIVAFLFAVIHPQGWAAVPALAALALVFAAIREWRGSVVGCMAAHALHNTLTLIFAALALT